jgi:hypothetical protein
MQMLQLVGSRQYLDTYVFLSSKQLIWKNCSGHDMAEILLKLALDTNQSANKVNKYLLNNASSENVFTSVKIKT